MTLNYKFKSYYVVWKQKTDKIVEFAFEVFKSYYVVWKPLTVSHAENSDYIGLNRTM